MTENMDLSPNLTKGHNFTTFYPVVFCRFGLLRQVGSFSKMRFPLIVPADANSLR